MICLNDKASSRHLHMMVSCHFPMYFVLTSARTHHISEFIVWAPSLHIHTFAMASSSPKNAVDEDYQLWDPREKEDTRIGKRFVVSIHFETNKFDLVLLISVCWGCIRSRRRGLHGQELQEQAKRHETVSLSDSHTSSGSGDCDR